MTDTTQKCFACDRKLGRSPELVDTRDDQKVFVGSDCFRLIVDAGEVGYQPPKGGPRLYKVGEESKATTQDFYVDAAYESVKASPLFTLLQNNQCDEAAFELAEVLIARANEWVEERAEKLLEAKMAETQHLELIGA